MELGDTVGTVIRMPLGTQRERVHVTVGRWIVPSEDLANDPIIFRLETEMAQQERRENDLLL